MDFNHFHSELNLDWFYNQYSSSIFPVFFGDKKYFSMLQMRILVALRISTLSEYRSKETNTVTHFWIENKGKIPNVWLVHINFQCRGLEQQTMFPQPLVSCCICWESLISRSQKLEVSSIERTKALNSTGFFKVKFYTRVPIRTWSWLLALTDLPSKSQLSSSPDRCSSLDDWLQEHFSGFSTEVYFLLFLGKLQQLCSSKQRKWL